MDHAHDPIPEPPMHRVEATAEIFRAAGDPERLRLLAILADGERCVSELAQGDNVSVVSQRLRVLRSVHLVRRRREGRHIYYSLADNHVEELVRSALEHADEA